MVSEPMAGQCVDSRGQYKSVRSLKGRVSSSVKETHFLFSQGFKN